MPSKPITRVGLLSDSHGRAAITREAAKLLVARGAQVLIHLGDVGSDAVIDAMVDAVDGHGLPLPPVYVVFGNCDDDAAALGRYAESLGVRASWVGRLNAGGKTVAFLHGHQGGAAVNPLLEEGVDYLCHGHTHRATDERVGRTRVINPGALFRAAKHTVALLDTSSDRLEFFTVGAS